MFPPRKALAGERCPNTSEDRGHGGGRDVVGHAGVRNWPISRMQPVRPARSAGLGPFYDSGMADTIRAGSRWMWVMLAAGGEAIADLAVLRDQALSLGPVALAPTARRLLDDLDESMPNTEP